jgi:hypothetical protein
MNGLAPVRLANDVDNALAIRFYPCSLLAMRLRCCVAGQALFYTIACRCKTD